VLVEPGDFATGLPAARHVTAQAERSAIYRAAFTKAKTQQDEGEATGSTPEPVARLVARILDDPSPRLRYTVGPLGQRAIVPLKRYLPQRLFELVLVRALGF